MSNASSIRCLITAGPTREFIDPVRFLSNPASGKMGYALAEAAVAAGWTVDLVAGPVALQEPDGVILYPVVSAEEMFHHVDALFDACDVLIMTAAVSDFRPVKRHAEKEKKIGASLQVNHNGGARNARDKLNELLNVRVFQIDREVLSKGRAREQHDTN